MTYTENQVVEEEEDSEKEGEAEVPVTESESGEEGALCFAAAYLFNVDTERLFRQYVESAVASKSFAFWCSCRL